MNKVTSNKVNQIKFDNLTTKQQEQVIKMLDRNEAKTSKELEAELKRVAKECARKEHKGLFNIFNVIKGGKHYKSILTPKFEAVEILGSMDFNAFIAQLIKGGAYTPDQLVNYVHSFELANVGDRAALSERGQKINALLMAVKKGEITVIDAIDSFTSLIGMPVKVNKSGEKSLTLTQSTAKYLFANYLELYALLKVADKFPLIHEELTKIDAIEAAKISD